MMLIVRRPCTVDRHSSIVVRMRVSSMLIRQLTLILRAIRFFFIRYDRYNRLHRYHFILQSLVIFSRYIYIELIRR